MNRVKSKAITKILTLLGFSSAALVFTACYGTMPRNYNEQIADSLSATFTKAEGDSIEVVEAASDDIAADAR